MGLDHLFYKSWFILKQIFFQKSLIFDLVTNPLITITSENNVKIYTRLHLNPYGNLNVIYY